MNKMSRLVLGGGNSLLLIAIAITFLMAMPSKAAKQLVLIAGVRQEGIQEFFYQHAADLDGNTKTPESLRDWSWPSVGDDDYDLLLRESAAGTNTERHNIFELLFREENNSLVQQVLMQALRDSWENSTNGIILGQEGFANVGADPCASDDTLKIIYRLMENLSITTKDVTLVLIYHTPRIEQWAYIWHQESKYESYSNFLCESDEDDTRSRYLETTMNPLKLSKIYRENGWNIAVLDEQGVRRSGFDPAHAIACDILDVDCEKGWVTGLEEESSRTLPSYEINELNENEKLELEQLFLLRDCFYKQDLELESGTKKFQIVNQELIWKDCRNHYALEVSETVSDVDFFLNAIQSQEGCGREFVDLSDVLASANSMTNSAKLLRAILLASIFLLAVVSGILLIRSKRQKKISIEFDGLFSNIILWRTKPTKPKPQDSTAGSPKSLCNACKFVRFDPNCIFCDSGRRMSSSEIGMEVERRIRQQKEANFIDTIDTAKTNDDINHQVPTFTTFYADYPPREVCMGSENIGGDTCIDTSHFDMNLRRTKKQEKNRRAKKEKETEQKSKVVKKLKELLVLKTEDGRKVYSISEPTRFSSDENLQTISFEEEDKVYV